jgi:hypothetical protein
LVESIASPIFATHYKNGRFVYRLGQPPFTGQRRVRFPYRLQKPQHEMLGLFSFVNEPNSFERVNK